MTTPMPRLLRPLVGAMTYVALTSFPLAAASAPFLVKDFDPASFLSGNNPQNLAVAGDRIFFSGWDAAQGDEPWVSDGSAAGTRRLADLCYGPCSSYPAGFVALGEAVVFHDNDGYETRIHRFAEGEVREVAVVPTSLSRWTPLSSLVFFAAGGTGLWRTDGTTAGTYAVGEFHPPASAPDPPEMAALNGAIYFVDSGSLQRLSEDGEVREVFSLGSPGALATGFVPLDASRFLFTGCASPFNACRAYVSDGTAAGTRSLEPVPGGALTADAQNFVVWRGRAYFETRQPGSFSTLVVSTDGTPAGTRLESFFPEDTELLAANATHLLYVAGYKVQALDAGLASVALTTDDAFNFEVLGRLGEKIVFNYGDPGGIARPGFSRVAASDGTPGGTAELLDGGGSQGSVLGGRVYFAGGRQVSGYDGLWRTDGSASGTMEVDAPARAPLSGWPTPSRVGATLVATATDAIHDENRHAYRIDPATLESRLLDADPLQVIAAGRNRIFLATSPYDDATTYAFDGEDLVGLPLPGRPGNDGAVAADDRYFFFTDVDPGQALWESDGSAAGTRLLFEFPPESGTCNGWCGNYGSLAISGDHVFFSASAELDGRRLSVWDRAAGEKRTLRDGPEPPQLMLPMPGGRLVFNQGGYVSPISLWQSDGTAAGTRLFHQVEEQTNLMRIFEMGGRLYFGLDPAEPAGEVLWTSDLTAEGTHPVAPLGDLGFRAAAVAGDRFYFSTENGAGRELGVTDGSAAGTRFFDLRPGPEGSNPGPFFALDDHRVVFAAAGDEAGYELWISDGTARGTYRLTDLNPGEAASAPQEFAQVGNRLFFQADDGQSGRELWGLELPPAGAAPCPAGRVCLLGGRFEISLVAHAPNGDFPARKEVGNDTSAVYSFFSPGNWEMLLKVLDGCAINGHRWVFAAAATDVGYTLRITDRETGEERVYGNDPGQASPAITDAAAFSCGGALSAGPAGTYNAGSTTRGAAPWPSSRP